MSERGTRDHGLGRVRALTRWITAGGVAAAAAFSVFAARSQPGRTTRLTTDAGTAPPSTAPPAPAPAFGDDGDGGVSQEPGLAPPPAPVRRARDRGGMAMSGGS